MMDLIILGILVLIIGSAVKIVTNSKKKPNNNQNEQPANNNVSKTYTRKKLMTDTEYSFYLKMKDLETYYNIVPQVNLASIIDKHSDEKFRNELFRNIDFAIFSKDYSTTLLLIELNDSTHANPSRRKRDIKVEELCKISGIPLIKFYTKYSNEKDYVINRIITEINTRYNNQQSTTTPPSQENTPSNNES